MSDLPRALITIWNRGEQVAHADHCGPIILGETGEWPGIARLNCYYFSILNLEPPVVFEHLSGRALTHYLDRCSLKFNEDEVSDLRYVHGRSEAMKGRHKVAAVLLAKVHAERELPDVVWLSYLPAIYGDFLTKYTADTKTA